MLEKSLQVAVSAWNTSTRYWLPDNILHGALVSVLLVIFGVIIGTVEYTSGSSSADILAAVVKSAWAIVTIGIFAVMSVLVHFTVGRPLKVLLGPEKDYVALKNLVVFIAIITILSVAMYEFLETNGIFDELSVFNWFDARLYFLIDFVQALLSTTLVVGIWHLKSRFFPTHPNTPTLSNFRFSAAITLFIALVSMGVAVLKLNT